MDDVYLWLDMMYFGSVCGITGGVWYGSAIGKDFGFTPSSADRGVIASNWLLMQGYEWIWATLCGGI